MMLNLGSGVDAAPTLLFTEALRAAAPDLFVRSDRANHTHAELTIWPCPDEGPNCRTDNCWYNLTWTYPAVVRANAWSGDPEAPDLRVENEVIEIIDRLPAPPVIPVEERIAAAPAVSIDHLTEGQLRMLGDAEGALRAATLNRNAAIRNDHTAGTYDWKAYAAQVVALIRTLTPPKLTPGQRAEVSLVRVLEAHQEVCAANQSLRDRLANAERAGDAEAVTAVRELLSLINAPAA